MYFTANAFLPDYLHHLGRADLVSAALTALNVGQIPASLLLLAVAGRLERAIWPHVVCGAGALAAVIGIVVLPGPGIVACAAVLGFFAAAILILMLAMPPLLAPPEDVHRVSAAMFTISYSCAVITPVFSGLLWDLTGVAWSAFVPLGVCAVVLMALAPTIQRSKRGRAEAGQLAFLVCLARRSSACRASLGALAAAPVKLFELFVRQIFGLGEAVFRLAIARISSDSLSCSAMVSRFCVFWIRNTIRKVTIVVEVLMTSCQVSL